MGQTTRDIAGEPWPPGAAAASPTRWLRTAPWLAAVAIGVATVALLGLLFYLPSQPLRPVRTGTAFGPASYVLATPALVAMLIVAARDWSRRPGALTILRQAVAFGAVLAAAFLLQQIFAAMAVAPSAGLLGPFAIALWLALSAGFVAEAPSRLLRNAGRAEACWAGFVVPFWAYLIFITVESLSTPPQCGVGCHALSPLPFIFLGFIWAGMITIVAAMLVAEVGMLGGWLRRGRWR